MISLTKFIQESVLSSTNTGKLGTRVQFSKMYKMDEWENAFKEYVKFYNISKTGDKALYEMLSDMFEHFSRKDDVEKFAFMKDDLYEEKMVRQGVDKDNFKDVSFQYKDKNIHIVINADNKTIFYWSPMVRGFIRMPDGKYSNYLIK